MNGAPAKLTAWPRRRWVIVVAMVFGLHLAAFHYLSPQSGSGPRRIGVEFNARWLTDPARARRTLDALLVEDPTLLAVASPRGFSGAAWLRPQPQAYKLSEWSDPERALPQPTQALGSAFAPVASAGTRTAFDPARKPVTPSTGATFAQPALRTASRLLVQGAISERPLAQTPALPSWTHAEVLADSRVQILVNDEGLVFSPRLAATTVARNPAQRDADQHALELARALRFVPMTKPGGSTALQKGVLVFQWHTLEPPPGAKE